MIFYFFIVSSNQQRLQNDDKRKHGWKRLHVALGTPRVMGGGEIHGGDGNVTFRQQLLKLAAL